MCKACIFRAGTAQCSEMHRMMGPAWWFKALQYCIAIYCIVIMEYCNILYCYNGILQYIVLLQWNIAIYCIVVMEYCNIFIAEYQYNQYNNNIIVPSAAAGQMKDLWSTPDV